MVGVVVDASVSTTIEAQEIGECRSGQVNTQRQFTRQTRSGSEEGEASGRDALEEGGGGGGGEMA